jgi:chromosome partitioning protein
MVQKRMNPDLQIAGILYTIVEEGTIIDRNTKKHIRETYGNRVRIFDTQIPKRTKVKEAPSTGESILTYDKRNDAAEAYRKLVEEMLTPATYIRTRTI